MTAPVFTTAPATGGRFVAASDQLELVGVLEGRRLVLYLDRFADNAPVPDARIELEVGAQRLQAVVDGDHYTIELAAPLQPGALSVVASVIAADVSDLLAGELIVLAPGESLVPQAVRLGATAGAGGGAVTASPPAGERGSVAGGAAGVSGLVEVGAAPWRGVAIGGGVIAAAALGWVVGRRGRRA